MAISQNDKIWCSIQTPLCKIWKPKKTRKIFLFQQDVKQVQVHFPGYLFNSWILMLENMSLLWVSIHSVSFDDKILISISQHLCAKYVNPKNEKNIPVSTRRQTSAGSFPWLSLQFLNSHAWKYEFGVSESVSQQMHTHINKKLLPSVYSILYCSQFDPMCYY